MTGLLLSDPETWRNSSIIKEVRFKASLSGGKGGQNVNKVSTKIELYWKPGESYVLSEEQKSKVVLSLEGKLSHEGELRIVSEEERSQLRNKEGAMDKFFNLIASCFKVKKKRRATKKSKASQERRLTGKSIKKDIKKNRRKPDY
ncbi:MAG: alternative ribosome rescue aminoacyl-tRNA hydrolase ArfB [Cytophagaceae bacterium]